MAIPDKYLGVLQELKTQYAAEALAPSKSNQSEFGYGQACGTYQGLLLAERAFANVLEQSEKEQRG